jgi:hypothetical protein
VRSIEHACVARWLGVGGGARVYLVGRTDKQGVICPGKSGRSARARQGNVKHRSGRGARYDVRIGKRLPG